MIPSYPIMFYSAYPYNSIDLSQSFIILPIIVMWKHDMLPSGVNDDLLTSGVIDEGEDEDFNDQQDDDWEDENDDGSEDDDNQDHDDQPNNQKKPVDWKHKFHATVTSQNRTIAQLKNEIAEIKWSKANLSEDDMAKIKEKYSEEDLEVIEKIIQNKTKTILDTRSQENLASKERNIFLKEFPEISEPEFKHVLALQKDYGYSLKKAYSILNWGRIPNNKSNDERKSAPSVSNSFNNSNSLKNGTQKHSDNDTKAFNDMDAFL